MYCMEGLQTRFKSSWFISRRHSGNPVLSFSVWHFSVGRQVKSQGSQACCPLILIFYSGLFLFWFPVLLDQFSSLSWRLELLIEMYFPSCDLGHKFSFSFPSPLPSWPSVLFKGDLHTRDLGCFGKDKPRGLWELCDSMNTIFHRVTYVNLFQRNCLCSGPQLASFPAAIIYFQNSISINWPETVYWFVCLFIHFCIY